MTKVDFYKTMWTRVVTTLLPQFDDASPKLIGLWNGVFPSEFKTIPLNATERLRLSDEIILRANFATEADLPPVETSPVFISGKFFHDIVTGEVKEIERIPMFGGFDMVRVATWPRRLQTFMVNRATGERVLWRQSG